MVPLSKTTRFCILLLMVLTIAQAGRVFAQSAEKQASGTASARRRRPTASRAQRRSKLISHKISLASGKTFNLYLPTGFAIRVAAEGMKRVRFMAMSPDGRVFVTDMYNRADNTRGRVLVLEGFDPQTGKFAKVTEFLAGLRNPNSIAFHKDDDGGQWLYLALTDKLIRYRYAAGANSPSGSPQVLATFPDYGLNYKYGGWHLTRTLAFGPDGKLYVSVGSSCNACLEAEPIRATISQMDSDGKHQRIVASGIRNAVGLKRVGDEIYATDMGADHLGDNCPDDTMYIIKDGQNYGWPYCYQCGRRMNADPQFDAATGRPDCATIPQGYAFSAHSSPLGLERFDSTATDGRLRDHLLVALHGSSKRRLSRGYRVCSVAQAAPPQDFITGFIKGQTIYGRPVDILRMGPDSFLVTDDYAGVVYYVTVAK